MARQPIRKEESILEKNAEAQGVQLMSRIVGWPGSGLKIEKHPVF